MTNSTPHPVRSIVVATDLSPAAERAVEQAALLAKRWNATLSLLHVFDDSALRAARQVLDLFPDSSLVLVHVYQVACEGRMVMAGAMADDIERYRSNERELAESQMDKQLARLGSDRLMTRMVAGRSAAVALVEEAGRLDADLTVIGRKGESSLAERLLGGTSESVLYNAKCNVLLVP